MSRVCLQCGQIIAENREWRGLRVERGPASIYWCGVRQPHLPPALHEIMWLLVLRRGAVVSGFALDMLTGPDVTDAARLVRVHICHLRSWLRAHALPFAIETARGEGYALRDLRAAAEPVRSAA